MGRAARSVRLVWVCPGCFKLFGNPGVFAEHVEVRPLCSDAQLAAYVAGVCKCVGTGRGVCRCDYRKRVEAIRKRDKKSARKNR